ncbi:TadE/TadG family type IV pilus assembly protein [Streptomyces sp. DSM 44915]|uniref:TadE/TadG family type IV pilus assembly protein n=1 Tax=Streptomyces chisholmiae TaxID=3075540 RepID=A0ABU2JK68_9ACTN|nr:TadE/TadG family type IV pilus assembly protein [Streptomyces sp. DSM 44915]MDT0265381.1 TadE/TadG family type IV pilus assembly protein [Streptomyces sp. DSM 44915]
MCRPRRYPAAGPPPAPGPRSPDGRRSVDGRLGRWRADRGVTAVEFAGWLPLLVVVALAALQLGLVGYAALQAGSAARAAARTAAQEEIADQYAASGRAALSPALAADASFELSPCGDEATVTASVDVPTVLPFFNGLGRASRTVTMPCD